MESVKLQKYLAMCGVASRRGAEQLIIEGKVEVNGKTANLGDRILLDDSVTVLGRPVSMEREKVYIALNKPRGYVTTSKDERGRKTVLELVPDLGLRLYPVGRLDLNSEGLLILTNDGEITNVLTHPKHHVQKIYEVLTADEVDDYKLSLMKSGPSLDGKPTRPAQVSVKKRKEKLTLLEFKIHEGKNRQVRKLCELAGVGILRLMRTKIGEIRLDVKSGEWRYLREDEIKYLKGL